MMARQPMSEELMSMIRGQRTDSLIHLRDGCVLVLDHHAGESVRGYDYLLGVLALANAELARRIMRECG